MKRTKFTPKYFHEEPYTAAGDNRLNNPAPEEENPFTQLCVWPGTLVGTERVKEFEDFMLKEWGCRVKYAEEVKTLPDVVNGKAVPDTGGRNDLFFFAHQDDIGTFSIRRLSAGIRWWEDVLGNGGGVLYPDKILAKYPTTWEYGSPPDEVEEG